MATLSRWKHLMSLIALAAVLASACGRGGAPQTTPVRGRALLPDGSPAAGARVTLEATAAASTAGADGTFEVGAPRPGAYTLAIDTGPHHARVAILAQDGGATVSAGADAYPLDVVDLVRGWRVPRASAASAVRLQEGHVVFALEDQTARTGSAYHLPPDGEPVLITSAVKFEASTPQPVNVAKRLDAGGHVSDLAFVEPDAGSATGALKTWSVANGVGTSAGRGTRADRYVGEGHVLFEVAGTLGPGISMLTADGRVVALGDGTVSMVVPASVPGHDVFFLVASLESYSELRWVDATTGAVRRLGLAGQYFSAARVQLFGDGTAALVATDDGTNGEGRLQRVELATGEATVLSERVYAGSTVRWNVARSVAITMARSGYSGSAVVQASRTGSAQLLDAMSWFDVVGDRLFTVSASGALSSALLPATTPGTAISAGLGGGQPVLSPDRTKLAYLAAYDTTTKTGTLTLLDVGSTTPTPLHTGVRTPGYFPSFAFSADSSRLVWMDTWSEANGWGTLRATPTSGVVVSTLFANVGWFDVSHDGMFVLFGIHVDTNQGVADLAVIPAGGGAMSAAGTSVIIQTGSGDRAPAQLSGGGGWALLDHWGTTSHVGTLRLVRKSGATVDVHGGVNWFKVTLDGRGVYASAWPADTAVIASVESGDITVIGDGLSLWQEGAGLLACDSNPTWNADAVIVPRMYAASSSGDSVVPLGPVVLSAVALSATSDQLYFLASFDGVKGSLRRLSLSGAPSVADVADGVLPQYVGRGLRVAYRTVGAGGALLATSGAASVPLMNGATAIQVMGSTGEDVFFATRQLVSPSDPQNGLYVLPWP